jgi:hypothetical protein
MCFISTALIRDVVWMDTGSAADDMVTVSTVFTNYPVGWKECDWNISAAHQCCPGSKFASATSIQLGYCLTIRPEIISRSSIAL